MRWATSGRLTPAAFTLIRISSGPGLGTARVSGSSTSGPPGLLMPITVICEGTFSMIFLGAIGEVWNLRLISHPRGDWQLGPRKLGKRAMQENPAQGEPGRRPTETEDQDADGRRRPAAQEDHA